VTLALTSLFCLTSGIKTRVLDPRPKFLRFHRPDPVSHSLMANKEAW
jgi:hypothetical protein